MYHFGSTCSCLVGKPFLSLQHMKLWVLKTPMGNTLNTKAALSFYMDRNRFVRQLPRQASSLRPPQLSNITEVCTSDSLLVPLSYPGVLFSLHHSGNCTTHFEYADLSTNVLKGRQVNFLAEFYSNLLQETKAPQCC